LFSSPLCAQPGGNIRNAFLYNPARVSLLTSLTSRAGNATEDQDFTGEGDSVTLKYNPGLIDPNNEAVFSLTRRFLIAGFSFRGRQVYGISSELRKKKKNEKIERLPFFFVVVVVVVVLFFSFSFFFFCGKHGLLNIASSPKKKKK
jgi:hypothetical protein